jgi:hypothetical protein
MQTNGVSQPSSKLNTIQPEISNAKPVNYSFICLHSSRSNAGFARLSWQPHLLLSLCLPTSVAPHLSSALLFLLTFHFSFFDYCSYFISVDDKFITALSHNHLAGRYHI